MFHLLSKLVLKKYSPAIVAIIGSVERKSTSQATFAVLASKFSVRQNIESIKRRNEIPLTILGLKESHSILGNLNNLFKAFSLIFLKKDYPEILILEMPVEHSEDIKFLTNFLSSYLKAIVVSSEAIPSESLKDFQLLSESLPKDCQIILNYDNTTARKMIKNNRETFGLSEAADIRATDILFQIPKTTEFSNTVKWEGLDEIFISFKIIYQGKTVPIRLFGTFGTRQVYAALGAIGTGVAFGMNLLEISESFKKYRTPVGMMKLIKGIKYTLVIDNTYNATLFSTSDAFDTLDIIKGARKIAVLGDVLFSGAFREEEHKKIGKKFAKIVDLLFAVGPRAKFITEGAFKAGMDKANIFEFFNPEKAGRALQNKIKQGDIILINGSEAMGLEQVVKEIMAKPRRAKKLLVRQKK